MNEHFQQHKTKEQNEQPNNSGFYVFKFYF